MEPNQVPSVDESELKIPEQIETPAPARSPLTVVIIVLLVAILLALLVGLYIWSTTLTAPAPIETERPTAEENNEPESTTVEATVDTLQAVSTSNEIDAIEADLDATFITDLDTEFTAIEAELDAAQGR